MIDTKLYSLLKVAETGSFTRAAELLSMTQPAVSHQVRALESDLNVRVFDRSNGELHITHEGEIVIKYARRMLAIYNNLHRDLETEKSQIASLAVGVTHTAESSVIAEVLAKYAQSHEGVTIKIITGPLSKLHDMLRNYELDFAVVEGKMNDPSLHYMMMDTDSLVLAVSPTHRLVKKNMVTLQDLKKEKLILRLPDSNTRNLFVASLESRNLSIDDFDVLLQINNVATIKDLIRRDIGVSVLAKSACLDELKKKKIVCLPIENLSMIREINIVYTQDFEHFSILQDIVREYNEMR